MADDALRPAGTALAPGVAVQPGSSLVGAPFPLIDFIGQVADEPVQSGWQAVLVVDGDPVEMWDRYAQELGVGDVASARTSCVVAHIEVDATPSATVVGDRIQYAFRPERFLTEPRLGGENRIDCSAHTDHTTMTMAVGADRRTQCGPTPVDGCAPRPSAHLLLQVTTGQRVVSPAAQDRLGTDELRHTRGFAASLDEHMTGPRKETAADPIRQPVHLAIPDGEVVAPDLSGTATGSRLPSANERLDDGLDGFLDGPPGAVPRIAAVPDGGRSLVAPTMLIDCNSGLVAVLEVPGRPADVLRGFDQADDMDDPLTQAGGGGQPWAGGRITTAGGHYLEIVTLDGGGRSLTLVTECGD